MISNFQQISLNTSVDNTNSLGSVFLGLTIGVCIGGVSAGALNKITIRRCKAAYISGLTASTIINNWLTANNIIGGLHIYSSSHNILF